MATDYDQMMKDGVMLKEVGERLIECARSMKGDDDYEEGEPEKKVPPQQDNKAVIALMLKKKMKE